MPKTVWLSLGNPRMWEPGDNAKTVVKKYFDYVKNQFNGTGYDAFDFQQSDCFTIDAKGTLLVNAKFIEKLDNDYSDGLVFLDSCYSLWDMSFRDAFGAKAFLGFTGNANIWVANMLSHDFFLDLSKKTRTAREAYDFSWGYVKHKTKIPPLDSSPEFKKFKETAEKTGSETLDRYKLYISGDDSPQLCGADGKFEGLSSSVHGMLIQARKFAVRDSDRSIEGEIGQLMICYTKYWFPGESAALKSPYCHGARVGDPTIEDVRNAQGILGGYKDGRERFTLIE